VRKLRAKNVDEIDQSLSKCHLKTFSFVNARLLIDSQMFLFPEKRLILS